MISKTWACDDPEKGVEMVVGVPRDEAGRLEADPRGSFRLVRCRDCAMYEGFETSGGHVGACFQGGLVREMDPLSFCSEGVSRHGGDIRRD